VYLQNIQLRNFRCFDNFKEEINSKIVLIEGKNGSGKTSILEALYYLCYLRSFKTRITKDLIEYNKENFFLKINLNSSSYNREIQAGFSKNKRSIKIDNKNAQSYKDLLDQYKIVAITEDDLTLIKGSPEKRRVFLDHYALLIDPESINVLKKYKNIVDSRNALFKSYKVDLDSYDIWTYQLWQYSQKIRESRIKVLKRLEDKVKNLFKSHFYQDIKISFEYQIKYGSLQNKNFDEFKQENKNIIDQEIRFKRGYLGAHFDDVSILWNENSVKNFSSRGQQKLLVVLLKIAQVQEIISENCCTIFLLDDFLTDFDEEKLEILISIIVSLNCQIIFTCPLEKNKIKEVLLSRNAKLIKI
jgi:DNA replication and repair protein RecF